MHLSWISNLLLLHSELMLIKQIVTCKNINKTNNLQMFQSYLIFINIIDLYALMYLNNDCRAALQLKLSSFHNS